MTERETCRRFPNPDQADADGDGIGDACDETSTDTFPGIDILRRALVLRLLEAFGDRGREIDAALDRIDHLQTALAADPGLVNARFKSVRTGLQKSNPRDWATPLWFAAINGRSEVVRYLLEHGADPSVTDFDGRSIAELARSLGRIEIAEQLETAAKVRSWKAATRHGAT